MKLPTTSYIITWVSYLIFGVESSSPLAASYLIHSACFQHEADQSRSFIASEVTKLWNSTDHTHLSAFGTNMRYEFIGHLNTKGQVACPSHHADVHFSKSFGTIWKPSAEKKSSLPCCRKHRKVSFSKNQSCTASAYLRNLDVGYMCRCLIDSDCTPQQRNILCIWVFKIACDGEGTLWAWIKMFSWKPVCK